MSRPSTQTSPATLLLVDDHTIVREGIKRLLAPLAGKWTVSEAGSAAQALDCMRGGNYAIAIVDLSMPGMTGLDLIRRMKADHPTVAIVVLTMHAEEQYAMRAFKAGASAYLTKDSAAAELIIALHKVADGGTYISASLAERVVRQLNGRAPTPRREGLSERERDVLQRLVAGQRLTEIADALHLSVKTVSAHKTRIQEKLQLPSMAALIRYGMEQQFTR
ncbi:response regulator [Rhizobacter fulvus]|jgi:DNA-binding NarL/FixJ family response regulator